MNRLKTLLAPPQFDDQNDQRVASIEYHLLFVLFFATLLIAVLTFVRGLYPSFLIALGCNFIILGGLWLIRKHYLHFVSYLTPIILIVVTTVVLIIENQRVHDFTILLYPIAIILSGLLVGRKAPIVFSILIIFCISAIYIAERNAWITEAEFNPTYLSDILLIAIFIMMTGFLVYVAINIINDNLTQLQSLNIRLQQSEANFRLLFREAPDAILITDENGAITTVNPGATTLLGYSTQELIGKQPQDFIALEDLEKRPPTQLSALQKGETFRHERILVRKDGKQIHAHTSAKALPDGRYQFMATDLSERIEAERAVRDLNIELEQRVQERTTELEVSNKQLAVELSERQKAEKALMITLAHTQALYQIAHALIAQDNLPKLLVAIVDNMVKSLSADDGLLITFDIERKKVKQFVRYRSGLESTEDVSYEELWNGLSGWAMRELEPALSPKGTLDQRESDKARQIRTADERGSIIVVPLHYRRKVIGTLTALNRIDQPDFTEDDVALMTAIANQASIAIENASLFDRLQQHAQKLEITNKELESFAYSISHDLRAPLRSIVGFSQIIFEDHADSMDQQSMKHIERVIASAKHMDELIDSLLTFSRLIQAPIHQTDLNLSAMVSQILEDLVQRDPGRTIDLQITAGITAHADRHLIYSALSNLLENAWKYTANTDHAAIEFGVQEGDNEIIYFIRDNGAGFDMEYSERLFTPFQRLHNNNEFPGHGVGLATVQRIIRRHGGEIWAKSQPNQGATFYFTLANPSTP
jgi:PAS domain S-box-containing protein